MGIKHAPVVQLYDQVNHLHVIKEGHSDVVWLNPRSPVDLIFQNFPAM
jgi:hypothetical protein